MPGTEEERGGEKGPVQKTRWTALGGGMDRRWLPLPPTAAAGTANPTGGEGCRMPHPQRRPGNGAGWGGGAGEGRVTRPRAAGGGGAQATWQQRAAVDNAPPPLRPPTPSIPPPLPAVLPPCLFPLLSAAVAPRPHCRDCLVARRHACVADGRKHIPTHTRLSAALPSPLPLAMMPTASA